jgi:exosortase/archaeosortase family protein
MTRTYSYHQAVMPEFQPHPETTGWLHRVPAWVLLLMASLPSIVWFFKRIDDGSDEPLGLLALGLAITLMWRDRRSLNACTHDGIAGGVLMLSSVLTIGTLPPMLRAALAVAGTGTWFGIHRKPGLMGLLILSLPLVASLQFYAGYPLRLIAAEGAVRILELGGIVVSRNGVNLSLGGSAVGVDPACGGIRMLWHALAAAMALAAIHRVSWRATLAGGALAALLVVPANTLRATWLALEEAAFIKHAGLGHGNTGLLCFLIVLVPVWIFISKRAKPEAISSTSVVPNFAGRAILFAAALIAPLMMIVRADPRADVTLRLSSPDVFSFNGITLPLSPLPPSAEESAFARSFPGSLSSHRWGEHQVILRRVTQATRKLHPSADCLRAAGFDTSDSVTVRCVDGCGWSKFYATREGIRLTVHERIVSEQDDSSWTDMPAWFWSALRHPLNGPWRAETVISR